MTLLAATSLVVGCSAGSTGVRPTSGSTVTATVTTSAPATSAAAPSTAATGTVGAVATSGSSGSSGSSAVCDSAHTHLVAEPLQPASHNGAVAIHVTTTQGTTCHTLGYPGVAVLDSGSNQVAQAVRRPAGYQGGLASGSTAPPEITLRPGDEATALVQFSTTAQPGGTTCPTWSRLLVTLPDTTASVPLDVTFTACLPTVSVDPLIPGSTGSQ